jgi:hypothetical protein
LMPHVAEIIAYNEVGKASQESRKLKAQAIAVSDSQQKNALLQNIAALQCVAFPGLKDEESLQFIRTNLIFGFSLPDFDFLEKIQTKIRFVEGDYDQIQYVEDLQKAIKENTGKLGNNPIVLEKKKVEPAISAWVEDYMNSPAKTVPRGNLEELDYVNQSPNTRTLAPEDREVLLKILKLYDICEKFLYSYRYGTPVESVEEAFKDFDLYATLPGLVIEGQDEFYRNQRRPEEANAPQAPEELGNPNALTMDEKAVASNSPGLLLKELSARKSAGESQKQNSPLLKPIDSGTIQRAKDLARRPAVEVGKKKSTLSEQEINAKLESLKKKASQK